MSKGDKRQYHYRDRSIRARSYARFLMPVMVFVAGACVWKDPVMRAHAMDRLQQVRPIADNYLTGTPLENMLSLLPAAPEPADAAEAAEAESLPQITDAQTAELGSE